MSDVIEGRRFNAALGLWERVEDPRVDMAQHPCCEAPDAKAHDHIWQNVKTHKDRKRQPVATGVLDYFPDAIRAVAECSFVGNEQHNPGTPLHWDREKSGDEADALVRHLMERGTVDKDGVRHTVKVAWRALALLQKEIEQEKNRE